MPEKATTEFWKAIKPIAEVFKPDALPEVYVANAPTADERYYVPFTDTVSLRPLWISPQQNKWCDILYAKAAGLVNRRYHRTRCSPTPSRASGATWSTPGPRRPAISSTRPRARAILWSPTRTWSLSEQWARLRREPIHYSDRLLAPDAGVLHRQGAADLAG